MTATLHILGTGPGDPELLTLKAVNVIKRCPVVISPMGSADGTSTALTIISQVVPLAGKTVIELYFPMKKIKSGQEPAAEVLVAWRHAAEKVLSFLDQGLDVCFPTLGDPAIYSTGYYLYETICGIRDDARVRFIPGVPAMSSCSASLATPICLGDEMVAIVPATFSDERLKEILERFDTIVLMKVHRVIGRLTALLTECELIDRSVLVERAGTEDERIFKRLDMLPDQLHYFSTILIRKQPVTAKTLIN